jgi:hypothetical protein
MASYHSILITKRFLWNVFSCDLPVEYDIEALRKIFLLNLIIVFGNFFLLLLGTIALIQKDVILGTVDFIIFSFLVWLFSFLRKTKNHNVASIIGTTTIGVFYFFLIAYGGVGNTAYVWVFTYPLISLFLLGSKVGTILSLLLLVMSSFVFVFGEKVSFFTSYSFNLIIRIIPSYIAVYLFAFLMEKIREIVQLRLKNSNIELEKTVDELEKTNNEKEGLIQELHEKINEINTLRGILPLCSFCKKIRDDKGYWEQVDVYIHKHSQADISHSLCPDCAKEHYPDLDIYDD